MPLASWPARPSASNADEADPAWKSGPVGVGDEALIKMERTKYLSPPSCLRSVRNPGHCAISRWSLPPFWTHPPRPTASSAPRRFQRPQWHLQKPRFSSFPRSHNRTVTPPTPGCSLSRHKPGARVLPIPPGPPLRSPSPCHHPRPPHHNPTLGLTKTSSGTPKRLPPCKLLSPRSSLLRRHHRLPSRPRLLGSHLRRFPVRVRT